MNDYNSKGTVDDTGYNNYIRVMANISGGASDYGQITPEILGIYPELNNYLVKKSMKVGNYLCGLIVMRFF